MATADQLRSSRFVLGALDPTGTGLQAVAARVLVARGWKLLRIDGEPDALVLGTAREDGAPFIRIDVEGVGRGAVTEALAFEAATEAFTGAGDPRVCAMAVDLAGSAAACRLLGVEHRTLDDGDTDAVALPVEILLAALRTVYAAIDRVPPTEWEALQILDQQVATRRHGP